MKKGIYRTDYGNAAYVSGPAERIPIELVTPEFIRPAEPTDRPSGR